MTIEPEHHGNLTFTLTEDLEHVLKTAKRPALVVTPSFELGEDIANSLPDAVLRERGTDIAELAERAANGVLVAPAAWAGLDTSVRWASVIIPKVPFPRPTVIEGKSLTRYTDSAAMASRRMKQSLGRPLRSPDAQADIYITDMRVTSLPSFVPERFAAEWAKAQTFVEGNRTAVKLNRAERNPRLRKAALAYHGEQCQKCGLEPDVKAVLEVHHDAQHIANGGERATKVEDVMVVCRNCHAAIHAAA